MEFTLTYNGELTSNGSKDVKQKIRRKLHEQLRVLWTGQPLLGFRRYLEDAPPRGEVSVIQRTGPFRMAPLVTERLALVAEIDVLLLRPEPAGGIVTQGGDIDKPIKPISKTVVISKYNVSPRTLRNAVKDGRLKDLRPANCASNSPMQFNEEVVASLWALRDKELTRQKRGNARQ